MKYPTIPDLHQLSDQLVSYTQLKHEYGARGMEGILKAAQAALEGAVSQMSKLPVDKAHARRELSDYYGILRLRPKGPRRLLNKFNHKTYRQKVEGALLGRMAGCTLGAPVEGWTVDKMRKLALETEVAFPPVDYWVRVPDPLETRYAISRREAYTRDKMKGVPVDDDIAYTLLGLLIVEEYGPRFTVAQVGKAWLKYLPFACTAEAVALDNLKKKIPADKAAEIDNPFPEWIGAAIRADSWGYLAPGWPERAAHMAYRDAYLSHRRNGLYGEMFWAAAISAAFAVKDPVEALKIGLTEIPKECELARAIRWALKLAPRIRNYKHARQAVDKRFPDMSIVNTINNACLTVWGITIGGRDLTKVLGEIVAMGLDNDCTAATAGSIVGAVVGKRGIPRRWYRRFNNTVESYLKGKRRFSISGLVDRFTRQTLRVWKASG